MYKELNVIGVVTFTCHVSSPYSLWANLIFILWFSLISHCLKTGFVPCPGGQIDGSWFDQKRLWVLVMLPIVHLPQCQWDNPQENGQIDNTNSSSTVTMIIHANNRDNTEALQCGHFVTKNTGNLWEFSHKGPLIQWNLSVTTTSVMKFITCDLFSSVF